MTYSIKQINQQNIHNTPVVNKMARIGIMLLSLSAKILKVNSDDFHLPTPSPTLDCPNGGLISHDDWDLCSIAEPCCEHQGDCDSDSECKGDLVCLHDIHEIEFWDTCQIAPSAEPTLSYSPTPNPTTIFPTTSLVPSVFPTSILNDFSCSETEFPYTLIFGLWPSEITVQIGSIGAVVLPEDDLNYVDKPIGNSAETQRGCLSFSLVSNNSSLQVHLEDSYGDGWNGAELYLGLPFIDSPLTFECFLYPCFEKQIVLTDLSVPTGSPVLLPTQSLIPQTPTSAPELNPTQRPTQLPQQFTIPPTQKGVSTVAPTTRPTLNGLENTNSSQPSPAPSIEEKTTFYIPNEDENSSNGLFFILGLLTGSLLTGLCIYSSPKIKSYFDTKRMENTNVLVELTASQSLVTGTLPQGANGETVNPLFQV